jgi:hypothetical protein
VQGLLIGSWTGLRRFCGTVPANCGASGLSLRDALLVEYANGLRDHKEAHRFVTSVMPCEADDFVIFDQQSEVPRRGG